MNRDAFLARVKSALDQSAKDTTIVAPESWRAASSNRMKPARATVDGEAAIAAFSAHFEAQGVSVTRLAKADEIPAAIAAILSNSHPGEAMTLGDDKWLASLAWGKANVKTKSWRREDIPVVGLSRAASGIAETGTLVLASGRDNPATLYYLPETHIVVVAARDIKGSAEDAIAAARAEAGREAALKTAPVRAAGAASSAPGLPAQASADAMPRTLAFISGASRTADVGGKLVRGAHGPKRLSVLVVG